MKRKYIAPELEVFIIESGSSMMAESVYIEIEEEEPAVPDATARRGTWGDLWTETETDPEAEVRRWW
jgi:hypothetical protein